jgi:excisionase family DNA binding protein
VTCGDSRVTPGHFKKPTPKGSKFPIENFTPPLKSPISRAIPAPAAVETQCASGSLRRQLIWWNPQPALQKSMSAQHHVSNNGAGTGRSRAVRLLSQELPITVREAAAYLGVSVQTVYLWVERKQIPHLRVMGRSRHTIEHRAPASTRRLISAEGQPVRVPVEQPEGMKHDILAHRLSHHLATQEVDRAGADQAP